MHAQLRPEIATDKYRQRFWANVDQRGPDECWEWTLGRLPAGYGRAAWVDATMRQAHRVAYALTYDDPGNLHVCHSCDNPSCVNPAHLFLGTDLDNAADRVAKGRCNTFAKLNPGSVGAIRWLYAVGNSQRAIGRMFGVSQSIISLIVSRKQWARVADWPAEG